MGALVEIRDVADVAPDPPLVGAHIDSPRAGRLLDAAAVDFAGWALGEGAKAVELRADGKLLWKTPVDVERPDVTEVFSNHPAAVRCGFQTTIDLVGTPPEFNLEAWVSFRSGQDVLIATINGRHRWRRETAPAFAELASVVVSCGDDARLLAETIDSALAQTYPHLELVLIDGSRNGRPREIAERYEGVRIFLQESPEGDAHNEGIRHTNGDFLVFTHAGDRLLPDALATGIALLDEHPEWAFTRGRCQAIAFDGNPLPTVSETRNAPDTYEMLLRGARAEPAAAAVYRRAVFEEVEAFDPSLGPASNLDLDLRISSRYAAGLHDEVVVEHRLSVVEARDLMRYGLAALGRQRRVARRIGRRDAYRSGRKVWRRSWNSVIGQDELPRSR